MKLLFDQNLSPKLPEKLIQHFPGSTHVFAIGLEKETDSNLWRYAKDHAFTIITKDSDFVDLATQNGPPPKVIWMNLGNCSSQDVYLEIQSHVESIKTFIESDELDILTIG